MNIDDLTALETIGLATGSLGLLMIGIFLFLAILLKTRDKP